MQDGTVAIGKELIGCSTQMRFRVPLSSLLDRVGEKEKRQQQQQQEGGLAGEESPNGGGRLRAKGVEVHPYTNCSGSNKKTISKKGFEKECERE